MNPSERRLKLLLLLVIALGFGLRLYNLGTFGFWLDEAITGFVARLPIGEIIAYTRSHDFEHPPLYYVMVHLWMQQAGDTEWTLRFLAVLSGTLTLALAFAIFRKATSLPLAFLSTLYLAVNPFHVAYSQENRMYAWISLLGTLGTLIYLKFLSNPSRKWLIAYILVILGGVFSHYVFVFLVLTHLLYSFFTALQKGKKPLWGSMLILTGVVFATGVIMGIWTLLSPGPSSMANTLLHRNWDPLTLWHLWNKKLYKVALDLVIAEPREAFIPPGILLCAAGIWLLIGWVAAKGILAPQLFYSSKELFAFFVVWLFFPLLQMQMIPQGVPGRFFSYTAPPFAFLATMGIVFLWKRSRPAVILPVTMLMLCLSYSYRQIYTIPKGDFHLAAAYIRANARPGDAVLLTHPYARPLALYYLQGTPVDVYTFPDKLRPPSAREIGEKLPQFFKDHRRLWLGPVDPGTLDKKGLIERWLSLNAFQVEKRWFPQSSYVALYLPPLKSLNNPGEISNPNATLKGPFRVYLPLVLTGESATTIDSLKPAIEVPHRFGDLVLLKEVYIDTLEPEAGTGIRLLLRWQILRGTDDDILVDIKLKDEQGRIWARRLSPMQGDVLISPEWEQGQEVEDRHGLWITECTPPGTYSLQLGLYNATLGLNVKLNDRDYLELAKIKVRPGPRPRPAIPLNLGFNGSIVLLGADRWPRRVEQGTSLPIVLYWLPLKTGLPDLKIRLELRGGRGQVSGHVQVPIGTSWYPPSRWSAGVCIKDVYSITIPGRLQPGVYNLYAAVMDDSGSPWPPQAGESPWRLGMVRVLPLPRSFHKPAFSHPADATLGDVAKLIGYDLSPEGEVVSGTTLRLTLYWHAIGEPTQNYTVFTHLVGPDGKIWGQKDNPPARGTRPTTTWIKGEYITDEYLIPINPDAPSGEYVLYIGMYDPVSGQRLPAFDANGNRYLNDAIPIATMSVR